jgi:hypothetical protein
MTHPDIGPDPFQNEPPRPLDKAALGALATTLDSFPPATEGVVALTASNDTERLVSVTSQNTEWSGLLYGAQRRTHQTVAVERRDGGESAVLDLRTTQNVLTRRKVAHISGSWVVRSETAGVFTNVSMTDTEIAEQIDTITSTEWFPDSSVTPTHPLDGFPRSESEQIEQQFCEIGNANWRPYAGYEASNQLEPGDWDVELRIDSNAEFYDGLVQLTRRASAESPTTLPAQLQLRITRQPDRAGLLKGDYPGEGVSFMQSSNEVAMLSAEQRAELRALLEQNISNDVLRPDPSRPEFAVPRELCRDIVSDSKVLAGRVPSGLPPAVGRDEATALPVFMVQDAQGRPARLTITHATGSSYIIRYACYDPTSTEAVPELQLVHTVDVNPFEMRRQGTNMISHDTMLDTAQNIVDAGPDADLETRMQAYSYPERVPSPQDDAEAVAAHLQQLVAGKIRPVWGYMLLPMP